MSTNTRDLCERPIPINTFIYGGRTTWGELKQKLEASNAADAPIPYAREAWPITGEPGRYMVLRKITLWEREEDMTATELLDANNIEVKS